MQQQNAPPQEAVPEASRGEHLVSIQYDEVRSTHGAAGLEQTCAPNGLVKFVRPLLDDRLDPAAVGQ